MMKFSLSTPKLFLIQNGKIEKYKEKKNIICYHFIQSNIFFCELFLDIIVSKKSIKIYTKMRKCLTTSPSYNIPIKSQKCKNIQNDTPTKQVKFQTKFRIKDQGAYPNKANRIKYVRCKIMG